MTPSRPMPAAPRVPGPMQGPQAYGRAPKRASEPEQAAHLCPIGVHLVLVVLVDEPRIIDAANLRLRRRAGHACGVRYLRARKKGGDLVDRLIARRQRLGKGLSAPGEGELIKLVGVRIGQEGDRTSTRLNFSH